MSHTTIISNFRNKLGVSLALCGVPLAMLLNFFLPIISWSPIIMIAAIFCIFNGFALKQPNTKNFYLTTILAFQILMVLYWIIDSDHNFKMLSFHAFIIVFYYAVKSNNKLLNCNYLNVLLIYSGILSIIFAFLEYRGYFSYEYWYPITRGGLNF